MSTSIARTATAFFPLNATATAGPLVSANIWRPLQHVHPYRFTFAPAQAHSSRHAARLFHIPSSKNAPPRAMEGLAASARDPGGGEQDAVYKWLQAAQSGNVLAMTALIRSAQIGNVLVADDATGRNAVHAAAENGHYECLLALFELARGVGGTRPQYSHEQSVAMSLFLARDAQGATALHYAAKSASPCAEKVINKLLDYGVPPAVQDELGQTAREVAISCGHDETASLLAMRSHVNGR